MCRPEQPQLTRRLTPHARAEHHNRRTPIAPLKPRDSASGPRRVIDEYLARYHRERNHQGLEGRIIDAGDEVGLASGKIIRRERLGGMYTSFYRDAA